MIHMTILVTERNTAILLKTGLIDSCPFAQTCSTSDYGRVVYVKYKDNEPRFKVPISYGSLK